MEIPYKATIAAFQIYAPSGTRPKDEKPLFDKDLSRIEQEVITSLSGHWSINPIQVPHEYETSGKSYVVDKNVFIAFLRKVYGGHVPISKSARNHVLKRLSAHFDKYHWIQSNVDQVSDLKDLIEIDLEDDREAMVFFHTLNIEAHGDNVAQISHFGVILEEIVRKINHRTNMKGFVPREMSYQYPLFDTASL